MPLQVGCGPFFSEGLSPGTLQPLFSKGQGLCRGDQDLFPLTMEIWGALGVSCSIRKQETPVPSAGRKAHMAATMMWVLAG